MRSCSGGASSGNARRPSGARTRSYHASTLRSWSKSALSLANTRIDFTFTGRPSHAAASPHLGRSALDAVERMNVGVNYMREHVPSTARIHYVITHGGKRPNVVPESAAVTGGVV